ncbi:MULTISPECIES: GMC family oxidoreductase [Streptomyces]|uniref:GMC family oxidoreductase n=1 Tax=Streptomyces TaxID=1883 RepID=UPI0019A183A1|nr:MULTISPECIES: FAD-dependent oxidoreductase [Streptomyces]GGS12420.1 GMC oxidoreductase [Streptomyces eurythermus]
MTQSHSPGPGGPGHDVIVVGAGSAGCVVARRMTDRGARVLLLEAGGPADNPAIHDPRRFGELWLSPQDWGYLTVGQRYAAGRRLFWPRGKVLGGSSALNAMIYARGAAADYDHWAYLGNDGWSWRDVLPVYRSIEDFDSGADELHGAGGPLRVMSAYRTDPVHTALIEAAAEIGIPHQDDYNTGFPEGISQTQLNIVDGRRHSAADAYLTPVLGSPGLTVRTGARVRRLLLDGTRCTGVEWTEDGRVHTARADRTVVAAGALESPRLLMLSGIGDPEHLRSVGVTPVVGLPGVGSDLHDHVLAPVVFATERDPGRTSPGLAPAQTHLFWRSRSGLTVPDLQPLHFPVPMYPEGVTGPATGFTLQAGIVRPSSRGTVRLTGPEPEDELLIDPATLRTAADTTALLAAVALCRELGSAPTLRKEWGAREMYPGPDAARGPALLDRVRRTVATYHHPVGTCRMGVDAGAVVDPRLRVYGVDGLRVADASVFPSVTTGNTHAPALLVGERAAAFLTE